MESEKFEGIYDVPGAARYLLAARMANEAYPVTSRNLIRWIRKGLALPDLANVPGQEMLITFEDLVSMRVIAALRSYDVSWGKIYEAQDWLRDFVGHPRPFATEQLWTAQSEVFAKFRKKLISASKNGQMALDIMIDYLIPISGLRFNKEVASSWEPRRWILLDPKVQFGAPCIVGTRVPTRAIWGMVRAGDSRVMVARAYHLEPEEVDAAVGWEDALAAA